MEMVNQEKLSALIKLEGLEHLEDFCIQFGNTGIVPGICTNEKCINTENVEPDCQDGYCNRCKTTTIKSGFILAGLI